MKSETKQLLSLMLVGVAAAGIAISVPSASSAQSPVTVAGPPRPLGSLKSVPVPEPGNLADFVVDRKAAIALGKALFWDMQTGSDGVQACASCHFNAGADSRSKNQVNPGLNGGDTSIQLGGGPNYQLQTTDFPLHQLSDPLDANSIVVSDANDVVSSQGVFATTFVKVRRRSATDFAFLVPDSSFEINGIHTRRVEPRNTPTVVNAVFNYRNFWDGRAANDFNGVDVFGARNQNAFVVQADGIGTLSKVKASLENSSLASQSVGPPTSPFEMSAAGRGFPDIGKKLTSLRPLQLQHVDRSDSALGTLSAWPKKGLASRYSSMIRKAFLPKWWRSESKVQVATDGSISFVRASGDDDGNKPAANRYTLMQYNFALFWGIAIQMYESTLVADDSRVDQFLDGNGAALTSQEQDGMAVFQSTGRCINCHSGPETSNAAVGNVQNEQLERMLMGNGGIAVYDDGFYNIGVRPTANDAGIGGNDKFGNPLSMTSLCQVNAALCSQLNINTLVAARPAEGIDAGPLDSTERIAVMGAFKVPGLRNVELTAPYFHNGGQATLTQVVQFYNRGGDFHDANMDNLDPDIAPIGLSADQIASVVAFLHALTDERVRNQSAPFDHPELFVPNGHPGSTTSVTNDRTGKATQDFMVIPQTGAGGGSPIPKFLGGPE